MSQKRNEAGLRIGAIEKLICRDVGRRTQKLIDATAGELQAAAETLAGASSVGLITGFFVPRGDVAAPETDGPVGTALLAAGLAACGVHVRIAVDSPCARAVRAAVAAAGQGGIAVDEIALGDAAAIDRTIVAWRAAKVDHAISIERCGRSIDGKPRNMRGVDVSPWTAPLDDLYLAGGWARIAIGDGGNEMGMGKLPSALIAAEVPNGAAIASVTSCDHLIVAGVSNWGAYGLMAALCVLRPDWHDRMLCVLTTERDLAVTRATVEHAGAVDGVTARNEATVDGFGPEIHGALIDELRRIACDPA
ncbi:MAG TPA: glutamate cyclase domain-containing protein [Reyranella sp.]|nr:glutamate cyclase domain-containing protein [Reyranella sp.]